MKPEDMFRIDGKVALVTGGAGGIGFACARALAVFGADIILADIIQTELEVSKKKIEELGRRCKAVICDVSDSRSVDHLAEEAVTFGGVDILIHSAAITSRKPILEMPEKEWNHILTVNLNGAHHMGKSIGRLMIEQGRKGKMIFIVSTGAFRAGVNFGAYGASKAAVVMFMKTLALELAPYEICVNAIAPTATETKFTEDYYKGNPDMKETARKNHPLGRLALAEDYMGTAVYLSSHASDFVTGSVIVVDGGKTAK